MKTINLSTLQLKLGKFDKAYNAVSSNGNRVPNQIILKYQHGSILQSYEELVAVKIGKEIYLSKKHDYSVTTNKYCGAFVGANKAARNAGLENGKYILFDPKH